MKSIPHLALPLILFVSAIAEEKKAPESAKPTDTAGPSEATTEAKVYAPTDLTALKEAKGQKVILEGKIVATGENRTETIRYLNFTRNFRESASLVFFVNSGNGAFTKDKLADYVGKKVRANGTLSEYKDALQIRVASLDQIKIVEEPAPAPTEAETAK